MKKKISKVNRIIKELLLQMTNLIRKRNLMFYLGTALIFLGFYSCKNENITDFKKGQNVEFINLDEIKNKRLEGVWIRKDYIQNLKSTNSPFLASSFLDGISSLEIYAGENNQKVVLNLNGVESSEATLLKNREKYILKFNWEGEEQSSELSIKNNEISITLGSRKLTFVKVEYGLENSGIDFITNNVLFNSKTYTCYDIDNNKIGSQIKFDATGKVFNFLDFSFFRIQTSFIVNENPKDLIFFKENDKTQEKYFHFKMTAKELLIYEIIIIKDTLHELDDEDYQDIEKLEIKYQLRNEK